MNYVPVNHVNSDAHRRLLAQTINQLIPTVQTVTLTTSSTTTSVTDVRMGTGRMVILTPTNALAAAEDIWVSTKANGSFILTHASAGTTRTFDYLIEG